MKCTKIHSKQFYCYGNMENSPKEIMDDLRKWEKKINLMMLDSSEGPAPQILKAIIWKRVGDEWCGQFKKRNKNKYKEAQKVIDDLMGDIELNQTKQQIKKEMFE